MNWSNLHKETNTLAFRLFFVVILCAIFPYYILLWWAQSQKYRISQKKIFWVSLLVWSMTCLFISTIFILHQVIHISVCIFTSSSINLWAYSNRKLPSVETNSKDCPIRNHMFFNTLHYDSACTIDFRKCAFVFVIWD